MNEMLHKSITEKSVIAIDKQVNQYLNKRF